MKRIAINARITVEAVSRLRDMNRALLDKTDKTRPVSHGKILETLILREDALAYVERELLPKE